MTIDEDGDDESITPESIGAASIEHTHDDRYYTDSEVDTLLEDKANTPAVSTMTLLATNWNNGTYSFEGDYPVANYDIEISIDGDNCTTEQLEEWGSAQIVGSATTNSCKAMGNVPTINIPIILKVVSK